MIKENYKIQIEIWKKIWICFLKKRKIKKNEKRDYKLLNQKYKNKYIKKENWNIKNKFDLVF